MAHRIKMTEDRIEKALSDARSALQQQKFAEEIMTIKLDPAKVENARTRLAFTAIAWNKINYLVHHFDSEVGWYGTVTKGAFGGYLVEDILVYPQTVTGGTVTTDEMELDKWYGSLDDNTFNRKRFHGHSHVNFQPMPSSTDMKDREGKLADLPEDDFFIFMIINKKGEFTCDIYDLEDNVHYETEDIDVKYLSRSFLNSLENVRQDKKINTYKFTNLQKFAKEMSDYGLDQIPGIS